MFKRAILPGTLILLCLVGFIASFTLAEEYYYLVFSQAGGQSPAIFHRLSENACGDQNSFFSCATVARSRYAVLFGVPLAVYGLFFYLVVLWLTCALAFASDARRRPIATALFWVTLLGLLEALVLLFITLFVVKAMCPLCLLTYILNLLLFVLAARSAWRTGIRPFQPFGAADPQNPPPAWYRTTALLTLAITVGAAAGVAAEADGYLKQNRTRYIAQYMDAEAHKAIEAFAGQTPQPIAFTSLPVHGPADAPVTIIEISDFLCPYCAHAADLMDQLVAVYGEKLHVRFVNLPLDKTCNPYMQRAMHQGACDLALGAVCAAEQGKLAAYQSLVFDLHKNQPSPEDLRSVVVLAGLSEDAFMECLGRPEPNRLLQEQIEQAHRHRITGTPTVFINRKKYQGRLSLEALRTIIDREIQAAEAKP